MITKEMLVSAAGEVSEAMVSSIQVQPHRFSPDFERKLRNLTRRAEHPLWYRMQQAAAILVALATAIAALYLASPTVRAAVDGWIRTTFGGYFQYYTEDTTPQAVQYDYYLPDEFDGYTLLTTIDRGDSTMYLYSNEMGQILSFDFVRGSSDSSLFIYDTEDCEYYRVNVGSLPAEIYISHAENKSNVIIWQDSTENVLFCIQVPAGKDQLIAFAEKVEKIEKT